MPLAKRIIPTLLCRGRQLVKGVAFDSWRTVGHPVQAVRIHQARGVDELVLLDIAATGEGRTPDLKLVEELTRECFMPIAVGGGVRSLEDVRALLRAGADKVVICTAAFDDREFVHDVCAKVGSQAIVLALDVKQGRLSTHSGQRVHDTKPGEGVVWQAQAGAELGVGEILLTSIDREGTMRGYDLPLIRSVAKAVNIPLIAHGGAGTYQHMLEAIEAGADAVAAGAMFQFTDATPAGAAQYLAGRGVEVRITKEESKCH